MIKDFLKEWIIPSGYLNLYKSLRCKDGYISKTSPGLDSFKGIHANKRIFILASGPSINTQDLKPLASEICISVSQFSLHQDIALIKPRYHVLAPLHKPFTFDTAEKIYEALKRYTWDFVCFSCVNNFEYSFDKFLEKNPQYKPLKNYYIDYQKSVQIDTNNMNDSKLWNPSQQPYVMRTVVFGAIMMAAWMGAKEIVLLGCDHDYLSNMKRTENHHFYKETSGFSDKEHLSTFNSERWFEEYYLRWKQYRLIGEHLALSGINIINATAGGMLDVFPRQRLEDILVK